MIVPALVLLGAGLLTAALDAGGVGTGATPFEAATWGAGGVLFARAFGLGALVLAVPVLVAGIELGTGAGGGVAPPAEGGDPLALGLPGGRRLEGAEVAFAAAYGAWALRFDLRFGATCAALAAVLVVVVARDGDLPSLTLLGLALLLPNLDRLPRLLR